MCKDLTKMELQEVIVSLEKQLFSKQQYAEMMNKFDCTLGDTKSALDKMRNELARRNVR